MPKLSPWTILCRRLEPIADELHRATPWRVEPPQTVEGWLRALTWEELLVADVQFETLRSEPRGVLEFPARLTVALEATPEDNEYQTRMARQVMHRLLFAMDLARRLPPSMRRDFPLTGEWAHDAALVLIRAWRTGVALVWAERFGPSYRGE